MDDPGSSRRPPSSSSLRSAALSALGSSAPATSGRHATAQSLVGVRTRLDHSPLRAVPGAGDAARPSSVGSATSVDGLLARPTAAPPPRVSLASLRIGARPDPTVTAVVRPTAGAAGGGATTAPAGRPRAIKSASASSSSAAGGAAAHPTRTAASTAASDGAGQAASGFDFHAFVSRLDRGYALGELAAREQRMAAAAEAAAAAAAATAAAAARHDGAAEATRASAMLAAAPDVSAAKREPSPRALAPRPAVSSAVPAAFPLLASQAAPLAMVPPPGDHLDGTRWGHEKAVGAGLSRANALAVALGSEAAAPLPPPGPGTPATAARPRSAASAGALMDASPALASPSPQQSVHHERKGKGRVAPELVTLATLAAGGTATRSHAATKSHVAATADDSCAKSADSPVDGDVDVGMGAADGDTTAAMARLRSLDEELEAAERAAFAAASKRLADTSAMHRRLREAEATHDQQRLARLQQARRGEAPTTPQVEHVRAAQAALRAFMERITAEEGGTAMAPPVDALLGERHAASASVRAPTASSSMAATGRLPLADLDSASVASQLSVGSRRSSNSLLTPSSTILRGPSVSIGPGGGGVRGGGAIREAALSLGSIAANPRAVHPQLGASGALRWRSGGARSGLDASAAPVGAEPRPAGDTALRMGLATEEAARLQQLLLDDDDDDDEGGDVGEDAGASDATSESKHDDDGVDDAAAHHADSKRDDAAEGTPPRIRKSLRGGGFGRSGVEHDFGSSSLDRERQRRIDASLLDLVACGAASEHARIAASRGLLATGATSPGHDLPTPTPTVPAQLGTAGASAAGAAQADDELDAAHPQRQQLKLLPFFITAPLIDGDTSAAGPLSPSGTSPSRCSDGRLAGADEDDASSVATSVTGKQSVASRFVAGAPPAAPGSLMTAASRRQLHPAGSSASVSGVSALTPVQAASVASNKPFPVGDPVIAAQRAERLEQQRLDMIDAALSALQAVLPGSDAGLSSRVRHNRDASLTSGVGSPGSASPSSPRVRAAATAATTSGSALPASLSSELPARVASASAAPASPDAPAFGRSSRLPRPTSADAGSVRSVATGISGLASVMTSASAAARRLTSRDIHEAAHAARAQLLLTATKASGGERDEAANDTTLRAVLAPPEEIQRLISQLREQGADAALHEILEPSADKGRADLDRLAASLAADGAAEATDGPPVLLAGGADAAGLRLRPAAKVPRGALKLRWTPAMGPVDEADSLLDA